MGLKRDWKGRWIVAVATVFGGFALQDLQSTSAQDPSRQSADLVVAGTVQNVFQAGEQHLVQILVQKSEVPRLDAIGKMRYPAPGETVYVHVAQRGSTSGRLSRTARDQGLPRVRASLTAYLSIGRDGQWESAGSSWYTDDLGSRPGLRTDAARSGLAASGLGVRCQRVSLGRETGLKVTSVTPNSPAAKAGIEAGDILTKADRIALTNEDQLAEAYRNRRGDFSLIVRDVNSGRDVAVNIPSSSGSSGSSVRRTMQPLGVKGELAFYGGEAAVKVTAVDPNSPAQKAGLVAGLVILKANGKTIGSTKDLEQAERGSRGSLELLIVNPKDKRERTIRATL